MTCDQLGHNTASDDLDAVSVHIFPTEAEAFGFARCLPHSYDSRVRKTTIGRRGRKPYYTVLFRRRIAPPAP